MNEDTANGPPAIARTLLAIAAPAQRTDRPAPISVACVGNSVHPTLALARIDPPHRA